VVFGGIDMAPQTAALRSGIEILIATPGRLLDHVQQKTVSLGSVSVLVLDEADRMLDMGFLPDLQRIVNLLPKARQSLLFSATFSPEIRKLAKTFLNESPVVIEVAARNATAENVTQVIYEVDRTEAKRAAVAHLIKTMGLRQVIVFTNTKIGASRLARELQREGIAADAIHGDKSQGERLATLEKFKKGEVEVMVATDVAARGLDIAELPAVINYDLPYAPEDYIHRIGRTGRAGASGKAMSLMVADDQRLLADIEKLVKKTIIREKLFIDSGALRKPRESSSESSREARGSSRDASRESSGSSRGSSRGPSRDRSDERDRSGSREWKPDRDLPRRQPASPAPSDPIFSQPYQPKIPDAPETAAAPVVAAMPDVASTTASNDASAVAAPKAGLSSIRRAPKSVPAILGGKPKSSS
jgi:superfamily II DNA/RNA helicase